MSRPYKAELLEQLAEATRVNATLRRDNCNLVLEREQREQAWQRERDRLQETIQQLRRTKAALFERVARLEEQAQGVTLKSEDGKVVVIGQRKVEG